MHVVGKPLTAVVSRADGKVPAVWWRAPFEMVLVLRDSTPVLDSPTWWAVTMASLQCLNWSTCRASQEDSMYMDA